MKITPPQLMPMAGYASRGSKPAESTLTDLWAKSLVLQDESGKTAVLVTLDLVGIDRTLSVQICEEICKKHHLQRSQVALATSHTHTSPVVGMNLHPMHYILFDDASKKLVDDYAQFLASQISKSVDQAFEDLSEASVYWGSGKATFAVNRRENKEAEVPQLRAEGKLKGPFDHDVPVLVMKKKGQVRGIAFGYACHSTTLSSFEWSGDYGGFAQIELEKKYPEAVALFWAGCGGDQNPLPRRTVELAKEYGSRLATAVEKVVSSSMHEVTPTLQTRYEEIPLTLAQLPTNAELEERTKSSNKYVAALAKHLLKKISNGEEMSQTYPYPIEVWKLGSDVCWVFQGGEVVVDYAISVKATHGDSDVQNTNVWVAGYANDVMAYIPSRRVLLEGGYEGGGSMVYYGLPTVWSLEVEQSITAAISQLVNAVQTTSK